MTGQIQDEKEPLIRAEELKHSFMEGESTVLALRGVSFEARTSEVTAIVGQSGCGKSTLLYLLGLLDRPESGEIYLKGRPMAKASDEARTTLRNESIGFVFPNVLTVNCYRMVEYRARPARIEATLLIPWLVFRGNAKLTAIIPTGKHHAEGTETTRPVIAAPLRDPQQAQFQRWKRLEIDAHRK